ncbi:MAG: efflux RND transporter periplasmic adaptor subunit [Planctomycetes bacterium]|nr:efflux RND transporter periplasmic adaptor subunit [Planctomycetota bacterium]
MPRATLLLFLGLPLLFHGACSQQDQPKAADPNLYRVAREDLPITVKENGELQAVRETIVRSEVEGQPTIIYLVPEGSTVKEGEKLVELDVSDLVEKRANQEISVEKAKSAWEQARTQLEILEKELTTKRNTAASRLRITEMDLEKLLGARGGGGTEGKNGDMVQRLRELVSEEPKADPAGGDDETAPRLVTKVDPRKHAALVDRAIELLTTPGDPDPLSRDMGDMANKILQQTDQIRLAMADLKNKGEYLSYSRKLAKKEFLSRNELDRDDLAYQSQLSRVTLAWNDLDLLINYSLQKERIQLTQDYANAKLELERVEASNDAERKKSTFDIDAKEKELKVATERLTNLSKQIKNAVIYAPTPGLVVYARVDRDRRGGEAIREGMQVRERQELIVLPDNTKMRCVVKVQEAQVDKVLRGQPAHIGVEAFPNEILTGRVTRVAPVADSSSSWMGNDKKVYTTIIDIDGENQDSRLRSRMAAAATITIGTVKGTLTVPQQAVRRDRSVNYVWKQTAQGPQAVPVKVGAHNQEKVEVLEGVAEGEVVYRTPPGGVPDPKFDQPVLPSSVPSTAPGAPGAGVQTGATEPAAGERPAGRRDGSAGGSGTGNRGPGGDGTGPGGPPGNRPGGMQQKKFADMTPEELTTYKEESLPRMQSGLDRLRNMPGASEETLKNYEAAIDSLKKALDANDLPTAQQHADGIRTMMRSMMGGRNQGRGPGGGGPGGGGNGQSGGN